MITASLDGFRPAAFRFLRDLARHNDRTWFEAHRENYERQVRDPMRRLVETLDARLGTLAPEIVGDPRRSMFRIHRDVRFSRDKSPYKTNAGAWLYHRDAGRKVGREGDGGEPGIVTSPRLVDRLCRDVALLVPLVRWLNRVLGYAPATTRTTSTWRTPRRGAAGV